jgi:hypothetical protein
MEAGRMKKLSMRTLSVWGRIIFFLSRGASWEIKREGEKNNKNMCGYLKFKGKVVVNNDNKSSKLPCFFVDENYNL